MFADYAALVLKCYKEKRANNALPMALLHPAPAKLKELCLEILPNRSSNKDKRMFDAFFGAVNNEEKRIDEIKKIDRDRFRPVIKFINENTKNPAEPVVELLAWLIDFEDRPFVHGKHYGVDDIEPKSSGETTDPTGDTQEADKVHVTPQKGKDVPRKKSTDDPTQTESSVNFWQKYKFIVASNAIFLVSAIAIFFIYGWVKSSRQRCMYWTGSAYVACSCRENHGDTNVIPLDTFTLSHLKKINRPDTISHDDIGSVWYIKTNNNLEYFTAGGDYPVDPKRKLNPITPYMIDKHILHKP